MPKVVTKLHFSIGMECKSLSEMSAPPKYLGLLSEMALKN